MSVGAVRLCCSVLQPGFKERLENSLWVLEIIMHDVHKEGGFHEVRYKLA